MQPAAVALTASSRRSCMKSSARGAGLPSSGAYVHDLALYVVLVDPHDHPVGVEPGALAVGEAVGGAACAHDAVVAAGRLHGGADLVLVGRSGAADGVRRQ